MANLFQLAEELSVTPNVLKKWLRSRGLGSGDTLSSRAAREARSHFTSEHSHPMASALNVREGLGVVKRHEDQLDLGRGIRVEERPKMVWSKVERDQVDVTQLSAKRQRDFFRQLRSGGEEQTPSPQGDETATQTPINELARKGTSSASVDQSSQGQMVAPQQRAAAQQDQTGKRQGPKPVSRATLAHLAHSLESMTERSRPASPQSEVDETATIAAMSEGVKPLKASRDSSRKQKKSKSKTPRHPLPRSPEPLGEPLGAVSQSERHIFHQERDQLTREATFEELFDRPTVQSLNDQLEDTKKQLKLLSQERDGLKSQILSLQEEISGGTPRNEAEVPSEIITPNLQEQTDDSHLSGAGLILDHFSSFGLNIEQTRLALLELLDHPQRGPELICSLRHHNASSLTRGFAIVCGADPCVEVAEIQARQGLIELDEAHLCSICQGSDRRGWYRRLHLTATHTEREKILIVGGDDTVHQQLKQLNREYPGMSWDFITGDSRIDQATALAKVSHKACVVLWGGVHLPHAMSGVIKASIEKANIPSFTLEPGTRSIAHLCRGILKCWGILDE